MHNLPSDGDGHAAVLTADEHGQLFDAQVAILSEIVSGMAHDMGTPLNVISGYAESMSMALPEDSPARRHAGTIVEQTRRVAGMLRQMLDVVRPTPGHSVGGRHLDQLACDVHTISTHMLRQHKVRSQFDAAGPQGVVLGDLPRLTQALYGLMRSAAVTVGPKGQLSIRSFSDTVHGTGLSIEGVVSAGTAANLAALAEPGRGLRDPQHSGLAFAERVLGEHGGGLEAMTGGDGQPTPGLLVRIGAPEAASRDARSGGETGG